MNKIGENCDESISRVEIIVRLLLDCKAKQSRETTAKLLEQVRPVC